MCSCTASPVYYSRNITWYTVYLCVIYRSPLGAWSLKSASTISVEKIIWFAHDVIFFCCASWWKCCVAGRQHGRCCCAKITQEEENVGGLGEHPISAQSWSAAQYQHAQAHEALMYLPSLLAYQIKDFMYIWLRSGHVIWGIYCTSEFEPAEILLVYNARWVFLDFGDVETALTRSTLYMCSWSCMRISYPKCAQLRMIGIRWQFTLMY